MPATTDRGAPITPARRAAYDRDGYVVVRGVFSPAEMAVAATEAERLYGRDDRRGANDVRCRWKGHGGDDRRAAHYAQHGKHDTDFR